MWRDEQNGRRLPSGVKGVESVTLKEFASDETGAALPVAEMPITEMAELEMTGFESDWRR